MSISEPDCLLQVCSPNGNVTAIVEQDANGCYLYLHGDKSAFGIKSCWVRNLLPAPKSLDVAAMRQGVSPMLPRKFCRNPAGGEPLRPESLSVVWAEEGDAAALCEDQEILAIIPSWSGQDGFHGYARDCSGESPLCWELGTPDTNVQFKRYAKAAECWKAWEGDQVWPHYQGQMIDSIEGKLGLHSNYYAIDGGNWPPKALLRIPSGSSVTLITVGMGLQPQPAVELYFENPAPYRRIELAVSLDASLAAESIDRIAGYLSGQSAYPWTFHTFLGHGHTIPANAFAEVSGGKFPFALLQSDVDTSLELPSFREDPVSALWLAPISDRERVFAEANGSAQLAQKLQQKGFTSQHNFLRREVV